MYFVYMSLWDEETSTGINMGDVMSDIGVERVREGEKTHWSNGDRCYKIQEMYAVKMEKVR